MYDKDFQRRGHTRSLRSACRAALGIAAALLLAVLPARAQRYANGLAEESTDPEADRQVIARMQTYMDRIHSKEHRPTVALVLSGGGAKGAAHVGVLRYLEEQGIPVDLICGTSMGGLIGGLEALGYDSHFLDSLIRNADWSLMLTDRIDRSYYSFARKLYRSRYQLAVPFHYAKKDFQSRIDDQVRYYGSDAKLRLGSDGSSGFGQNTLMSSLPSGYVYGFNVNNLLSSLSVGYQDSLSFADLPIPYFCVATDVVSCKAKNWSSGSLKTAMRSTMSIPAMFTPVRTEGLILVDGGTRNNFPVDLAKAMGADIIIGVDLSDADLTYSQVNNLGDIMSQFITMLGKHSFDRNVSSADVFIKPNLEGYNMLSFNAEAIDTMIHRGYEAARGQASCLSELKKLTKGSKHTLNAPRAIDINRTPVQLYAVEFDGVSEPEAKTLLRKIKFKQGERVDAVRMNEMMSVLHATGVFSSVTYSILGTEEPYLLHFDCAKGPRHDFGLGFRMDSEEWPSIAVNLGLNAHKLNGLKLDVSAKVGRNQMLTVCSSLDVPYVPTINLEASLFNMSASIMSSLDVFGLEARYWGHFEKLYLSNIRWTSADIKVGVQNRYYSLPATTLYGQFINAATPERTEGSYQGAFFSSTIYTFDSHYYPSKGVHFGVGAEFDPLKSFKSFRPVSTVWLNFKGAFTAGPFTLVPDVHFRTVFNRGESLSHGNWVGGMVADRYIDGQIPFIGFGNVYAAKDCALVLDLDFRFRIARNFFITATGGVFKEDDTLGSFISSIKPTLYGAGLEFGYNTFMGPLRLTGTWSNRFNNLKQDLGIYVSFGFDF